MSPPDHRNERDPYQRATDDRLTTFNRRQQTLAERVDALDARVSRLEQLLTALVHEMADAYDRSTDDLLAALAESEGDEDDLPGGTGVAERHSDSDPEDDHTRYL